MIIELTTNVEPQALSAAILLQYPKAGIVKQGNKLTIEYVAETQELRKSIEAIIAQHDYITALIARQLNEIREQRDKLLANSDYVVIRQTEQIELINSEKLEKATLDAIGYEKWLIYRQALRDLPLLYNFENPKWPTAPTQVE